VLASNYADWFERDLTRRAEFLRARIARITPLYLVALLLATPFGLTIIASQFPPLPP
jgi:peptidoglycan/LPS O-acetylase OafA/YrhL